jgi:iron complex transport system substrate-binding protein
MLNIRRYFFCCCLLMVGAVHALDEQRDAPRRIVSISLCTDQLLLMMVERDRITALTQSAARAEESYMASAVGDIPLHHGRIEEIIALKPDLVVGGTFAAQGTARLLRELGYRVELAEPPTSMMGVQALIRYFGQWTSRSDKAEEMIQKMDQQLASIQQRYADKPQRGIMVYSPNGYTIGSDTLEDEIFRAAGYRNLAADMGITGFQTISLEQLVAAQPDFVQIDNYLYQQSSLAGAYINHPALQAMLPEEKRLYMPTLLRDCAGPMVVDAVEYLASRR